MNDQHGNPIPSDLILLENEWIHELFSKTLDKITQLDWYKPKGWTAIFVSKKELDYILDGYTLESTSEYLFRNPQWIKIDSNLHRWSPESGFYDA